MFTFKCTLFADSQWAILLGSFPRGTARLFMVLMTLLSSMERKMFPLDRLILKFG